MTGKKKSKQFRKKLITKSKPKNKFNYRSAVYIKEREIKNKEIENRRKRIEEYKRKQEDYDDSSEEENPLNDLLKTFNVKNDIQIIDSDSESKTDDEEFIQEDINKKEIEIGDEYEDSINSNNESDTEVSDQDKFKAADNKPLDSEEIYMHIDEKNEEDEETVKEYAGNVNDPFTIHFQNDLDNELYQVVSSLPVYVKMGNLNWPNLGNIIYQIPKVDEILNEPLNKKSRNSILENKSYAKYGKVPSLINKIDWNKLYIKSLIQGNISKANYNHIKDNLHKNSSPLTNFQKELLSIINNYQDLLYFGRTFNNESQIRFVYCLHIINHVLKTRTKVLHHNAKIKKAKLMSVSDIPEEYRDQGLVRPKILILVPFRYSCLKIVELLISIFIVEEKGESVINKNRFMKDFGSNEIIMPKKNPKPEDYEQTFTGNIDDTFKIGISITKKALKLYSDFYSSDIIIASVLGMRMTIGAEGEEERDYDFLASIELLIIDQIELFLMQNWDHLLHIFNHLHLQPKKAHDTDFSRVRSWCINGWSKYYRQTLIFSAVQLPEIHGIFNKFCYNYAGKLKVMNPISTGSIVQVVVQVPQVFQRFNVSDHTKFIEARFEFFTTKVLSQFKDSIMNHTLIFVPSYFDYVKLRNYFRKEEISFVQICEYSRLAKIARARDMFFHSDAHFLLYTERFHFFRRIRIKGIRHIIFYAPPVFSHFYSEMCNFMQEAYQNQKAGSSSNMTVTTIYCKYDVLPLSAIVGSERANKMISSNKTVHMIMTEI
ncbi:PREDICTED: digestive organ expansion factor homolog [Ceratosolen solmsi marchali]|uniref:Digestive organ expansion factor homolog n=1 Tax=Ceratosolen solmsi marchali TaxID=326594 RepID=A0AAJ6YDX0_9HYME|nr:PREDICTED: digestive organ expansion factor homolog [Ceratosolen solmsi marchali]